MVFYQYTTGNGAGIANLRKLAILHRKPVHSATKHSRGASAVVWQKFRASKLRLRTVLKDHFSKLDIVGGVE